MVCRNSIKIAKNKNGFLMHNKVRVFDSKITPNTQKYATILLWQNIPKSHDRLVNLFVKWQKICKRSSNNG